MDVLDIPQLFVCLVGLVWGFLYGFLGVLVSFGFFISEIDGQTLPTTQQLISRK